MSRVLIIDDDSGIRTLLRGILEDAGYEVAAAEDGESGFRSYAANPVDLVLTDIYMPNTEGIETIRNLRRAFPDVKIVAMLGIDLSGSPEFLSFAKKARRRGEPDQTVRSRRAARHRARHPEEALGAPLK